MRIETLTRGGRRQDARDAMRILIAEDETIIRLDLRALLESWIIHPRAERKAEGTVRLYATGVRAFLAWCERQSRPATLDRPTVAAFIAELLNDGR